MILPVILIGAGGHARVLIDCLALMSVSVIGIVDTNEDRVGTLIDDVPVIGTDEAIKTHPPSTVNLVNAIGSVSSATRRKGVFLKMQAAGYSFASVRHPSAIVARRSRLFEGVQLMAGSIIQPGVVVGPNTIINTKASIDHDCMIGAHVHVAPGATLSGGVHLGEETHVGTGATIIQGIVVGSRAVIGAGAVVVRDVQDGETVLGVPARGAVR